MIKNNNILLTTVVIAFLIFFYPYIFNKKDHYEKWLEVIKSENYQGIVKKKYIDKDNHNDPTILFSNGTHCTIFLQFYSKIDVGDSILKKKGSTKIFVYSVNGSVIFDNDSLYKKYTKTKK